jgi:hypothetical protein
VSLYKYIVDSPWLGPITFVAFWLALIVIGVCLLLIRDNRGKFGLRTLLVLIACVAVYAMILKMWLYIPAN